MADEAKTPADQVGEIAKLVQDAQDKLDQVSRALRTLEQRFAEEPSRRPRD
jgi:hypothetical protein